MNKLIPTRFDSMVALGGSTNPWRVFAIDESELVNPIEVAYVVKLFKKSVVEQTPCIAKEFICNQIAKEFDLLVPETGIINLHSREFTQTLRKQQINILKERFAGNTFASMLLDGPLVTERVKDLTTNIEDRATIYAFDCFIQNVDRWGIHKKANLIIHNEQFLLIDHELTLSFIDNDNKKTLETILNKIDSGELMYPFKSHLFFNSLKTYAGDKEHLFDTFHEYLTNFNVKNLIRFVYELENNFIDVGATDHLFDYIRYTKTNASKFCKVLLNTIL